MDRSPKSEGLLEIENAEVLRASVRQFRALVNENRSLLDSLGPELSKIDQLTITTHLVRCITELAYAFVQINNLEHFFASTEQSKKTDEIGLVMQELRRLLETDRQAVTSVEQFRKVLCALEDAADILETQASQLLQSGFEKVLPSELPQA